MDVYLNKSNRYFGDLNKVINLFQMLRHYSRCILLIESNEKFKHRKVNGGPFQGELSRRGRETRSLLTMLIRSNPKMTAIWSASPRVSAEYFEEIKVCFIFYIIELNVNFSSINLILM